MYHANCLDRVDFGDMAGKLDQQLLLFLQNLLLEYQLLKFPLSISYLNLQINYNITPI